MLEEKEITIDVIKAYVEVNDDVENENDVFSALLSRS